MTATRKPQRIQIPDQFRDRAAKRAFLAALSQDLSSCTPGSDDYQSVANKIAKANATQIKRKTTKP